MIKIIILSLLSFNLLADLKIGHISSFSVTANKNVEINFSNRKKPIVAIFISKDCPCSKGNLGYINNLAKEFPEFDFLGIHSKKNSTNEEVKNYISDKNLSFEVLNDFNMKIATDLLALKTPHAYIISPDGVILYNGGVTNTTFPENAKEFYLKNALTEVKNHKEVSKKETRTLGCFIVR